MDRVCKHLPGTADAVLNVAFKNCGLCIGIGRADSLAVSKNPCLSLLDSKAESGFRSRVARIQNPEKLLAEVMKTLVIQIADNNHCRMIVRAVTGKGLSMPFENAGQLIQQDSFARIRTGLQSFRDLSDPLLRQHSKGVGSTNDARHNFVQQLFPGLVFNQYLKVHAITSRQDSRCTTGRPGATLRLPCSVRFDRR